MYLLALIPRRTFLFVLISLELCLMPIHSLAETAIEDTESVIQSAKKRIARGNEEREAMCAGLLHGMTKSEVAAVLGGATDLKANNLLVYGREKRITIHFDEDTGEAKFIYGCARQELADYAQLRKDVRKDIENWHNSGGYKEYLKQKSQADSARAKRKADREKRAQEKEDQAVQMIDCLLGNLGKPKGQEQECPEP